MPLLSRLSRAFVAVMVAATVVIAPAGPASAGIWQLTDSFELATNPASRWSFTTSGTCTGPIFSNSISAPRTGSGLAAMEAHKGGDWCALGRTITLTPVSAHPGARCTAGVWTQLWNASTSFNLEVIDPDTWNYIALKSVVQDWSEGWILHTVSWTAQRTDVVLRFAVGKRHTHVFSAHVELDDVVVQCAY
ncbi:hypothetical protein [Streptosporangium sp. NPDC006930]|uniref:hypothetical protein n=1 Tax=Streptosporangium sp. NPDC006930 TaxID=3154783 RepID=UPI0034447795